MKIVFTILVPSLLKITSLYLGRSRPLEMLTAAVNLSIVSQLLPREMSVYSEQIVKTCLTEGIYR